MSIATFLQARKHKLGPAKYKIDIERNVEITAPDGPKLLANIFFPRGDGPFPTILIRTPYLRAGFATFAAIYAERGFITVLQACRGTDGSEGKVDPLVSEREDGLATLEWLNEQSWFDGRLGTTGPSYLGYVQWAICDKMPEKSALSTHIATAEYRSVLTPKGAIDLQLWFSWMQLIKELGDSPLKMAFRAITGSIEKRTWNASLTVPLLEGDIQATGDMVPFWRRWMGEALSDEKHWKSIDCTDSLGAKTPPNFFVSGWYDFMIDQLLRDYQTLRNAGHAPYLTIGPWFHVDPKLIVEGVRSTIGWMQAQLNGDISTLRTKPVRIHISGLDKWHEYDAFPPPGAKTDKYYLAPKNAITSSPVKNASPATYRYDPNDPTPNLGGAIFAFTGAGPKDNQKQESRSDILVFTGPELTEKLTFIGQPKLTLFANSSLEHTDFFTRLCDVAPNGRSTNICDGFVRVSPTSAKKRADGKWKLEIDLHHSAHQFLPGHRLRLQVSSGAHPRFSRNPGTGESLLTAEKLVAADQEIFFDEQSPSALTLPLYEV